MASREAAAIVNEVLLNEPDSGRRNTLRTLAVRFGVSHMTVARILDSNGLRLRRVRLVKVRTKPDQLMRTDVVGLFVNPPDKALVLCFPEDMRLPEFGSGNRDLRSAALLGDVSRFSAALEALDNSVVGGCFERQRHEEFLSFLRQAERGVMAELDLRLLVQNQGTYEHPKVKEWIQNHRRFQLHPSRCGSSWWKAVASLIGRISRKNAGLKNVGRLTEAIEKHIGGHGTGPARPFVWLKVVEERQRAVSAKATTESARRRFWQTN